MIAAACSRCARARVPRARRAAGARRAQRPERVAGARRPGARRRRLRRGRATPLPSRGAARGDQRSAATRASSWSTTRRPRARSSLRRGRPQPLVPAHHRGLPVISALPDATCSAKSAAPGRWPTRRSSPRSRACEEPEPGVTGKLVVDVKLLERPGRGRVLPAPPGRRRAPPPDAPASRRPRGPPSAPATRCTSASGCSRPSPPCGRSRTLVRGDEPRLTPAARRSPRSRSSC